MSPKVYLIKVPHQYHIHDRNWPLGLLYINAFLRAKGIDSRIVDLSGLPQEQWHLPLDGDVYGVSCTTPDFHHAVRIAEILRRETNATLVLGGVHATARPAEVLAQSRFDIVVRGEGEQTMFELATGRPWEDIPGVSFRHEDGVRHNPERPLLQDIDLLPPPDIRDLDYEQYVQPVLIKDPASRGVALITSRGCPFQCIFCASSVMWKRKVRFHSVAYVTRQVRQVMDLGIRYFFFCDDTLLVDRRRTKELLAEFKRLGIVWRCSSTTHMMTPELAQAMYDAGCRQVDFGIESGSDRMLRIMKKASRRAEHEAGVRAAKEAGLMVKAMLMVGLPGESEEDVRETVRFVRANDADMYALTVFVPLPGCDVADHLDRYAYPLDTSIPYEQYFIVGADKKTPIVHQEKDKIERWRSMIWEAIGQRATLDIIYQREQRQLQCEAV